MQMDSITDTADTAAQQTAGEAADLTSTLYAVVAFFSKQAIGGFFEQVGSFDLTATQMSLLFQLDRAERELTLKEAASRVSISLGAASRAVDGLVRRGYAKRREDAEDRRMKRIRLTDKGLTVVRRFESGNLMVIEQFLSTMPESQRSELESALRPLIERREVAACLPDPTDQ